MPILSVTELVVRMGQQEILRGVSLEVARGGITCVLGPNGVGKTTLMRAVSGIYPVASGSVRLAGQEIAGLGADRIVRLGLGQAPEGRQIFAPMSVAENLRLGAFHQPREHFEEDLAKVFGLFPILKERYRQKAGSLSGGEQQMLTIGRALMGRPRLLLLDEPSLGLAPLLVKGIFELVARIRSQGTSILLVEQNARAALAVSDFAYVMEGGRMVLSGPAAELAREERVAAAYLGGHVGGHAGA